VTSQVVQVCNDGTAQLTWNLLETQANIHISVQTVEESLPASPPEIFRLPDGSVDCEAYENYPLFEPPEVAFACNFATPVMLESNPAAPTDTGYALDIGYVSDNFVSFQLNNFTGQTVVGTNAIAFYGLDFDPSAVFRTQ
jgi:hypothetical protein